MPFKCTVQSSVFGFLFYIASSECETCIGDTASFEFRIKAVISSPRNSLFVSLDGAWLAAVSKSVNTDVLHAVQGSAVSYLGTVGDKLSYLGKINICVEICV